MRPRRARPDAASHAWPRAIASSQQFADEADRRVLDALAHADLDRPGHPLLDRAEAVFAILEHEAMHQETLLYMWHRLPFEPKRRPAGYQPRVSGRRAATRSGSRCPRAPRTLGVDRGAIAVCLGQRAPGHR